ncbi:hypothetical protein [Streptomyces lannensis]|uniref:Uncharacterized protein n=1 Tax=Streptomyces lannensis TaxID=766498 RepID=A0ABP7LEY2_9ACTN
MFQAAVVPVGGQSGDVPVGDAQSIASMRSAGQFLPALVVGDGACNGDVPGRVLVAGLPAGFVDFGWADLVRLPWWRDRAARVITAKAKGTDVEEDLDAGEALEAGVDDVVACGGRVMLPATSPGVSPHDVRR